MTLKWAVILNDPEFDDALMGGGVESEDGIFFPTGARNTTISTELSI